MDSIPEKILGAANSLWPKSRVVTDYSRAFAIRVNSQALDEELLKLSLSPIAAWIDDPEVILAYGSRHVYVRHRGRGFEGVGVAWFCLYTGTSKEVSGGDTSCRVKFPIFSRRSSVYSIAVPFECFKLMGLKLIFSDLSATPRLGLPKFRIPSLGLHLAGTQHNSSGVE